MKRTVNIRVIHGLIMIVVSIFFFCLTDVSGESLYLVPYIALFIMFCCGLASLIKGLLDKREGARLGLSKAEVKKGLQVVIFFILSFCGMIFIGFYTTFFVIFFVIHLYICAQNGKQKPWVSLMFATAAIIVTWLIFGLFLNLRVPTDVLLF